MFINTLLSADATWALRGPEYLYGIVPTCEHHRERYASRQMRRP